MRILIFGVTGMIGHKMWQSLSRSHDDVVGTLHRGSDGVVMRDMFANRAVEHVEAADFEEVAALLDRTRPTVIVNCIGITKRKTAADDLATMFRVNTLFPHHLARWAVRHGCRVVQFSTDCVFDGTEGNYDESSVVTAHDLYGQTKYFGELDYDHCLTIRTSMIGRELSGRTELLEWFLAQAGKTISGFINAQYSGLTTNEMARVLNRIVLDHPELWGKYQVAGPVISKYALLCKLRDAFGIDVQIVPEGDFVCDRTLGSQRFEKATGITIPSWDEMLVELTLDRAFYDAAASISD
jgi:dTDP-4-dehydrorhamnose reductase